MKKVLKAAVIMLICSLFTLNTFAAASNSYVYNSDKKAVEVPEPYTVEEYLDGKFGEMKLNAPADICVAENNEIYILDSGNSRIVVLDKALEFSREINLKKDGENIEFLEAKGIFVDGKNTLYIADKKAEKVYVCENDGNVKGEILSPPADKVDKDFEYTPVSVVSDTAGIVYVISSGSYAGALQYDEKFNFLGFYGSEQVTVTAKVLLNEFWKKILSESAAAGLTRNVPTSIISLDIDSKNFVYTLKGGSAQVGVGQIRKLNTLGANILLDELGNPGVYGDTDTYYDSTKNLDVTSNLKDLVVDSEGFISAVDATYGRIFQYDTSANMLYAFGGKENRLGNFQSPVAIEALGDRLLVLDDKLNSVTVFRPTEFAVTVRTAIKLNEDGKYEKASGYWKKVLGFNAYYELANNGMGAVCEQQGKYDEAMMYYELAENKEGYSSAFSAKRDIIIKKNFLFILLSVITLLILTVAYMRYSDKHRKNSYDIKVSKYKYPLYCLRHPFRAYYELKTEKKGSVMMANIILFVFFLVTVIEERLTEFHFSDVDKENFNVLLTVSKTVGLFVIFVLCNWASSTLADGEGTLKEIWIFSAYALLPVCISKAALTVISNVLSLDEAAFWGSFIAIAVIWSAIHMFVAVREVHQYSTKKTIGILLVTVIGMYLSLLIITLGYSLFSQLLGFISTVISEYKLK